MRFRRVPIADKVPDGSGADSQKASKIFNLLGITHEFMAKKDVESDLLKKSANRHYQGKPGFSIATHWIPWVFCEKWGSSQHFEWEHRQIMANMWPFSFVLLWSWNQLCQVSVQK